MFSDAFVSAHVHQFAKGESSTRSGNLQLITALSKWVLNENGVLRVKKVEHHLVGSSKILPREYTILDEVVSVRPLLHTQYERFIRSAYPYYASSFSMMVGVVLFSFVFLYYREPAKVTTTTTKKTN
ncbi:unnamed protein product [Strongylus vulgaris]|uniref:OST48 middle domain-containing protein n=1 Tax=Strongylus vulgaris TaxID=40348 RepID=A0A3P7LUH6_STRVU|nr:unnamed protein product [Strongylus vulgaris]